MEVRNNGNHEKLTCRKMAMEIEMEERKSVTRKMVKGIMEDSDC